VAKIVNTLPSKRETREKLDSVERELNALKNEEVRRDAELGIREKQFQLLLQCIFDLKSTLMEDQEDNDIIMDDPESKSVEMAEDESRSSGHSSAKEAGEEMDTTML